MAWSVTADPERFEEADAWFRSRIPYTIEQYDALDDKARKQAFWITAALELDAVQTIFDELAKSNEKGTPFEEFQKNVEEKLGKLAPDGFHLETVYRNWVQKAYNTGRWYQLQDPELTLLRPYLMFDAVLDSRTTPTCKACDGIVKRHDDGFWLTHCPPLHHRCRSSLRSLRAREAQRRGITEGVPEGTDPQDDFGKAPPLTGDDEHLEPKDTRFDPEVWAEFKRRQLVMLEELDTANQAARAARLIRDQQQPSYWFEREFNTLYGEQAGRAVAWGKAMEHRGRAVALAEAKRQHAEFTERIGITFSQHQTELFARVSAFQEAGFLPKDVETLGALIEALEGAVTGPHAGAFSTELEEVRALAALIGHRASIQAGGNVKLRRRVHKGVPPEVKAIVPDLVAKIERFWNELSDKSLQHADKSNGYVLEWRPARGYFDPGARKIVTGAYLTLDGTVRNGFSTAIHEMGHGLEALNTRARQQAEEFLRRRTAGEPLRSLNELNAELGVTTSYPANEVARKDRFLNPYMGKEYADRDGNLYATEISSMALEHLHRDASNLIENDVESFWFALGQLAGDSA